ncbi:Lysophosphatidic acid acyltransferase [Chondrus crispus]|uniref:Lysophosphatidic acid acyltransferase n=1 Tax=Chondrus crispus TaxID=2769 RepID=R7Q8P1_CHOCR|nr:Lysophosphatidic acid acyltransferase [Chondrus crispus]CDF33845.1 Lysophosphatidic acid acyltransferase [Chondrus crispus]|eukprot:XP_005713664.1 Lysophosphatidic acid acyltransferase [Chondrus crispus]
MTRLTPPLTLAIGLLYSLSFSVWISCVTAFLVDIVVALTVITSRTLKVSHRALVGFCSSVLRTWFSVFMGHLEHFGGITLVMTGDSFCPNESALLVCNHRSWADTIVLYSLARQVRMHGDVKFLAKRSLLVFPIYGFAGWILDVVIFIKRESDSAAQRMTKVFSSLTDPRRERAPYWLINYLEGTRFTRAKLRAAQDFAKKRDLKTLDHVLQPRTKGFIATVHALRGSAKAVYDVTIGYQESDKKHMDPTFPQMYFTPSLAERIIHVHQRRIPLDQIPQDEEELKRWVYKLYEQKDDFLRGFREKGHFDGRPMRWNRMTWMYWVRCQVITYGLFLFFLYCALRLVSAVR